MRHWECISSQPREHMPLARKYAERALSIDSSLSQAHGTLGLIHLVYDWDYGAAQAELAAADSRESAITTLACTAHLLDQSGRTRHAEEEIHQVLEFDPRSARTHWGAGLHQLLRGQV